MEDDHVIGLVKAAREVAPDDLSARAREDIIQTALAKRSRPRSVLVIGDGPMKNLRRKIVVGSLTAISVVGVTLAVVLRPTFHPVIQGTTPTDRSTGRSSVAECAPSDLSSAINMVDLATHQWLVAFQLVNNAASACSLAGYPTVTMVNQEVSVHLPEPLAVGNF
jgi:hypothetical protein